MSDRSQQHLDKETPVDVVAGKSGEAPTLVDPSVTGSGTRPVDETRLARGTTLGRYVVLERIGAGGMGVVYAAYDPQLDRKVALKLLHGREDRDGGTGGRTRILREAQAMARLSHPNVVAVHDVGVVEDTLFVAMEFVEGETLGAFIANGPKPWAKVLPIFEAAGRGLAAAHAVGLVHRDFKPDNVMIGADGRVRVMDFGLARTAAEITGDVVDVAASSIALSDVDRLTRTGALVGTPAYMAPELLGGGAAEPRSDQFAFCVALHRALYGNAPFAGDTLAALFAEVSSGRIASGPIGVRVPHWLASAVRRGLAPDATKRFATMDDLLLALDAGRRRRGRIVAASLVVAGGAVIGLGWVTYARPRCTDGREKLEGAWGSERRDAVRDAFVGSGAAQAEDTAERTIAALDGYADAWAGVHLEACEASRRGEQSDLLLDLRMTCLQRRVTELDATTAVLGEADRDAVMRAADVVAALPSLAECSDAERLLVGGEETLDVATAAAIDALRPRLARARALLRARRIEEGLEVARPLAEEVEALGHRALTAEALFVLGVLVFDSGDVEESVTLLQRACFEAEAGKNDEIAVRAWSMLVHVQGYTLADREAGDAAVIRAEAAALRAGSRPELVADVLDNRASLYLQRGEYERGLADHQEAHRLLVEAYGELHVDVGNSYLSIGNALYHLGRAEEALGYYEQGRAVLEQVVGPRHPSVAKAIQNIGNMQMVMGHPEEGLAKAKEALSILEEAFGPNHPAVGEVLFNMGWISDRMERYEDALAYFEKARERELPRLGDDHPLVAEYEASMGIVLHKLGRDEEAREHHVRALEIFEKALGPDHNNVARVHNDLALVESSEGNMDAAIEHHLEALRIRRKGLPPDHPELAMTLDNLTSLRLDQKQFAEAFALCEELVPIREKHASEDPEQVVDALLMKAEALAGLGRRSEARTLVERATALAEPLDAKWRERAAAAKRELE